MREMLIGAFVVREKQSNALAVPLGRFQRMYSSEYCLSPAHIQAASCLTFALGEIPIDAAVETDFLRDYSRALRLDLKNFPGGAVAPTICPELPSLAATVTERRNQISTRKVGPVDLPIRQSSELTPDPTRCSRSYGLLS